MTSAEDGQLLVYDSGPDGKFTRIFPNDYSQASHHDGVVRANAPLTIPDESYPFQFTATDAGPGELLVIVAEKGANLTPLLQGPAFEPTKRPE